MKKQSRNYDFFSANVQAAEAEEELAQAQQRIAELEALNQQLQALTANSNATTDTNKLTLPLDLVVRNPEQVRRYFDPVKLASLTASIKELGVRSALWVRPIDDGKYLLIAGERRYRAAIDAGLSEVPVVIVDVDDASALKLSLLENLQREDLNPVEETEGILNLLSWQLNCTNSDVIALLNRKAHLDKKKIEEDEDTKNVFRKRWEIVENVFATVGRLSPESFRVARLPLLNMPEDVLSALRSGKLEYTKARAIARVKDEAARAALLQAAIEEELSLTEIQSRIKAINPQENPSLKSQFKDISSRVLKSPHWNNPEKAQEITQLLEQLENLLSD